MQDGALPNSVKSTAETTSVAAPTDHRRWIPNALTVVRLVIALAFFALLAVWRYPTSQLVTSPVHPVTPYLVAALLFGLAAVTDAIDGPLARRWNVVLSLIHI